MAHKPETNFRQNVVLPFLKTLKSTHFFPVQQVAINGTPDYLLCSSGRFVALELKAPDGVASKLQLHELAQVERCKGVAIIASPETWPEVKDLLSQLDKGEKSDRA